MQLQKKDLLRCEKEVVMHTQVKTSIVKMKGARFVNLRHQLEFDIPLSCRPTHIHVRAGKISFWICKDNKGEGASVLTNRGVFIKIPLNVTKVSFPNYNYPKEQHCYGRVVWG